MAELIRIDDPQDPRIAGYMQVRERDLVGREGHFMAEGQVVVRMLVHSRLCRPVSLLLAEKRLAAMAELIDLLPLAAEVFVASQAVMDQIVGFPIHRGILALGRRAETPSAAELLAGLGEEALVLVLCGIGNHDNMGGLFRNAAAFGADAVILDADCCDALYRKAIRVSVGASLITPFAQLERDEDLLGLLRGARFEALSLSPSGAVRLSALKRPPRVAVLLGSEGPGLSPDVLAQTRTVAIPMATGFDSLNVATTAGIVLHHLGFAAERER
ncbi:RNA methyltransferase [Phenylobacterium aquaticum]|uniref:TrmH family RNA methyltransferase n=1 Tax=Phenylobacterium aquaticum TaxID=1763816 RepID=UPI0026E9E5F2|nr:RNA methyltransferase [Phenylobacterium aquaticum]